MSTQHERFVKLVSHRGLRVLIVYHLIASVRIATIRDKDKNSPYLSYFPWSTYILPPSSFKLNERRVGPDVFRNVVPVNWTPVCQSKTSMVCSIVLVRKAF